MAPIERASNSLGNIFGGGLTAIFQDLEIARRYGIAWYSIACFDTVSATALRTNCLDEGLQIDLLSDHSRGRITAVAPLGREGVHLDVKVDGGESALPRQARPRASSVSIAHGAVSSTS